MPIVELNRWPRLAFSGPRSLDPAIISTCKEKGEMPR
jgi:hypothetical protein